uniref:Tyrosine specific protein phosphatases domain-containing protein n=1 Tax=Eptatretus burgeri TaxID=7764 RepID=A0A8C4NJP8_EPTBU
MFFFAPLCKHSLSVYSTAGYRRALPKYSRMGERLRRTVPGPVQCSVSCRGRLCKYENPERLRPEDQALSGVYSSWVTDGILAMARPSTEVIHKYDIITQFQENNIKTVINLQQRGEHSSCGFPLKPESGFTYLPRAFMDNGIFFYNFCWKDYGVVSLTAILDMVKVLTFALQEGKVAIHCHAGLGRTGKIRYLFVHFQPDPLILLLMLSAARTRYEARKLKFLPKIVHVVCGCLLKVAAQTYEVHNSTAKLKKCIIFLSNLLGFQAALNQQDEAWDRLQEERCPVVLSSLMFSWLECLCEPALSWCSLQKAWSPDYPPINKGLYPLEKAVQHTLGCIVDCIAKLGTLPESLELPLLARIICAFTQFEPLAFCYIAPGGLTQPVILLRSAK